MSKPSHIPLFPDAYLRDTTHFTVEEHGANLLLFMAAWGSDDCSLPNDERRLAALVKLPVARWRKIGPTILELWTAENGRIWQKRLRKEWAYVLEKSGKARAAVAQRKDRQDPYGRTTNVPTNVPTDVVHLGGGGGEGVSSYPDIRVIEEEEGTPFRIVEGGK